MEKRDQVLLAAVLFVALTIRLWLAPMRGHVHDIEQLKMWVETSVTIDLLSIYSISTANYPPLGLLPLVMMGHLFHLIFSPEFDTASTTLTALLKLPAITADLITAVLLFIYLHKHHNRHWAFIGLTAYALNPAIIYTSAWWGQLESLVTLPMLLSVMTLANGRSRQPWFWLAIAILVKPQAAVLGPVIFIGSIVFQAGRKQTVDVMKLLMGIGTAVFTGILVLLPFMLTGQLPALIAQIRASAGRQLFLTMNAHNFWYLVTFGQGSFAAREAQPILDTQPLFGPWTGWQIGLFFFILWTLFIAYRLCTAKPFPPVLFWAAAGMVLGFFMLPAEAHERYLFPAFPFLVLLLPYKRPFPLLFILFTTTFFLNLLWVDSALPLPAFNHAFMQNLTLAISLAALNLALFIRFAICRFQSNPPSLRT